MDILIRALIPFLVVLLILYLVNMLPINRRAQGDRARDRHYHRRFSLGYLVNF